MNLCIFFSVRIVLDWFSLLSTFLSFYYHYCPIGHSSLSIWYLKTNKIYGSILPKAGRILNWVPSKLVRLDGRFVKNPELQLVIVTCYQSYKQFVHQPKNHTNNFLFYLIIRVWRVIKRDTLIALKLVSELLIWPSYGPNLTLLCWSHEPSIDPTTYRRDEAQRQRVQKLKGIIWVLQTKLVCNLDLFKATKSLIFELKWKVCGLNPWPNYKLKWLALTCSSIQCNFLCGEDELVKVQQSVFKFWLLLPRSKPISALLLFFPCLLVFNFITVFTILKWIKPNSLWLLYCFYFYFDLSNPTALVLLLL